MLDYIQDSEGAKVADEATREIDSYVARVKADPKLEEGVMTFGDCLDRERRDERVDVIKELLEEKEKVPESLSKRLTLIKNMDKLKRLTIVAAKVGSIREFEEVMDQDNSQA